MATIGSPPSLFLGGDVAGLARTGQYVSDLFQSGALTCLICIASVRRTQAVRHAHTHTHTHTQIEVHLKKLEYCEKGQYFCIECNIFFTFSETLNFNILIKPSLSKLGEIIA